MILVTGTRTGTGTETGTGIMIVIETGSGIDTENEIVKGLETGMLEVAAMEGEEWIGGREMEEKVAGIGTVIGAGHDHLLGMVTEGHLEVQFAHISGLFR